jgi:hypothetical protein
MRYVKTEARYISDVKDRLGSPEDVRIIDRRTEEYRYIDKGRHVSNFLLLAPPVFGIALWLPVWPWDYAFGDHYRALAVRFDSKNGLIDSVRDLPQEQTLGGGSRR